MAKTSTSRYDIAEHLRTPEEMVAYLQACLEEADGDAAFIAKLCTALAEHTGLELITAVPRNNPCCAEYFR